MNIFVTNTNPFLCAKALDDLRVNKMITETCQMLCSLFSDIPTPLSMNYPTSVPFHPCTLWVGENSNNFNWVCNHLEALIEEYDTTSPNQKHQKARQLLPLFRNRTYRFPDKPRSQFVNCTPFKSEVFDHWTIYRKYRELMRTKWTNDHEPPRWTNRQSPDWR